MEPFRYHVFICQQKKQEGAPSCPGRGGEETMAVLRRELASAGLEEEVQVTGCDCLGLCGEGPNLVVYPEGLWYTGVKAEDVPELVKEHLVSGQPREHLVQRDGAEIKRKIIDHDRQVKKLKELMEKAGFMPGEANAVFRGFQESRVALTGIELDIFNAIGEGSTAAAVAGVAGTDPRATESLLNALVAIRMLNKKDGIYHNTPLATRYLCAGSPDDSREALMHVAHLWHRWSNLTECVRKGTAVDYEQIDKRSEERIKSFIAAMHRNASFAASWVVGTFDLEGVNKVLDLGGGSGAYAMALVRRKPGLKVTVFDLPNIIPLTEKYLNEEGLGGKVQTRAGDMMLDPLGEGYDLVLISAICHMWSPEENLALFERIMAVLNPKGQIVIQDFILEDNKTAPRSGVLFALNMLVNT
ncbi:MAG: methyltransferase domain-containing protein, partial [Deltaproteobacteria bacterium]